MLTEQTPLTAAPANRLVLASRSPARQKLLTDAGINFEVIVSEVDEDAALKEAQKHAYISGLGDITPAQTALLLAKAKARAVAATTEAAEALVLGCDSVFEFEGQAFGKPHTEQKATERITAMSGRAGILHTGHWLVDNRSKSQSEASALRSATVYFDSMSEAEISAYVASQEPLHVAGSFTIDGFGAAFIKEIDGEFHTVVGLSINALRSMLREMNTPITDFWKKTT